LWLAGPFLAATVAVTTVGPMNAGVASATAAVVNPNVMDCIPGDIDVGSPDAYSTTQNLWWIPAVYYWTGSGIALSGYGDWHYKSNTGSLTTVWTNYSTGQSNATYNSITVTPGSWYAVYVWVYSNGDWFGYWAQNVLDGSYWC
jgi:hypothetical protein